MLPLSRRSSVADLTEEVPHKRATWEMNTFTMALGLWCETSGITRQNYQSLIEALRFCESYDIISRQTSYLGIRRWFAFWVVYSLQPKSFGTVSAGEARRKLRRRRTLDL